MKHYRSSIPKSARERVVATFVTGPQKNRTNCTLNGKLLSAEPYFNGLLHGTAKQWSDDGKLLGTYTMRHGTGLDLWWGHDSGLAHLSEARYVTDGKWHGFDWWLNEDQKRHFWNDQLHGIERFWNCATGRLRRGYPRYWVHDQRITKRQYLRVCAKDPTLPRFREKDNRPQRRFPPEVEAHCMQRAL